MIAFVINSFSEAGRDAERILVEIACELERRGHEVRIGTFDRPSELSRNFAVPIELIEKNPTSSGVGASGFLGRGLALRRWARENQAKVVVAFMPSAYVLCSVGLKGVVPVIASEHLAPGHHGRVRGLLAAIGRALSAGVTAPVAGIGTRIPYPIPKAEVPADPIGGGRKYILAIGPTEAQEKHSLLLEAFSGLAFAFPDWSLRIVGKGSLRELLKRYVYDLGLAGRVFMPRSSEDRSVEYLNAQIFAVPSHDEGFGTMTAEALSYGLPVVGLASSPAMKDLVVDGVNGLLTDEFHFSHALASLMNDADLRQDLSKGLICPQDYALPGVADQWERLIATVR